jgi:hypothetical protein
MSTSTIDAAVPVSRPFHAPGRFALTAIMVAGCVVAAAAAHLIAPAVVVPAAAIDPDLARLMQGMAFIKLAFVAVMAGLLVWRFGRPMTPAIALGYLSCIWTISAATVLIWQSSWLGLASVLFHGAGLAFMVLGLRDDRVLPAGLTARAARPN